MERESSPADSELDRLASRAVAGDSEALEQLLVAAEPKIMRICARMLPCRQDAEDACQEAMLLVARKISGFRGASRFTTWLHSVASNSALSTYRTLKRRAAERSAGELPTYADPRTTSVIAGSRIDLLDALESMAKVRPELVEPLVLRDIAELDYAEIARQLGQPLGTVKSRIHDARLYVRPLLERID
jgi:RNA polymerase sigma-70 factor, ECF subfamily